jgi:hypothetical protein
MTRARDLASGLAGVRPFASATGSVGGSGSITVTLPAGRFTVAPIILATPHAVGQNAFAQPITGNTTTTSFSLENLASNTGSAISFTTNWFAIQMTSGSASA